MKRWIAVPVALVLYVACRPSNVPRSVTECQLACDNLRVLGCVQANPLSFNTECGRDSDCHGEDGLPDPHEKCAADGHCMVTCEDLCSLYQHANAGENVRCIAEIASCDDYEGCWEGDQTCSESSCPIGGHRGKK